MKTLPQFVISAPTSNAGKTTISLGLMRLLERKGLKPQPFKCGPDYIDPKFHQLSANKESINLDLYMMPQDHLKDVYHRNLKEAGCGIVEGVMGLFDGAKKDLGSTAQLAKTLDIPVILVVDAKAVAYSVAPLLYGFKNFDPKVTIAGVIFNRVNTQSHFTFLKEACEDVGLEALGYVPFIEDVQIPSRHLGLSIENIHSYERVMDLIADKMEETVDWEKLLEISKKEVLPFNSDKTISTDNVKIAVALDDSFNFIYKENINALRSLGDVQFFSPIYEEQVPEADLLYFPGGYPECNLDRLAGNISFLNSLKDYAERGGRIFAECGGLMYLGQSIIDKEGKEYAMAGIFDFKTSMAQSKLHLGYREIHLNGKNLKAHEFHYSTMENDHDTDSIGYMKNARGMEVNTKLYRKANCVATYAHIYFADQVSLEAMLELFGLSACDTRII
ncbi:cobyrinate a,c-diamide synthase [Aureibacter tunicatorum]|uniref:Cobyrinate a,c-diamide synthase n=1 Tax=Aureibacter tunicatorum TaxID=866807 RepID=A0AAE4BR41_9BACT|nr:cobyrinate a,c-diamide synthase [Aureibacter tunicatorum]MDR6237553.1 cobyrinic acid a,c-diamide synthase [Aureibacter tunicatorum]BDD02587.1 cobyrinic acid a,c-diamide synthase [Aureibacter tunicatorum]